MALRNAATFLYNSVASPAATDNRFLENLDHSSPCRFSFPVKLAANTKQRQRQRKRQQQLLIVTALNPKSSSGGGDVKKVPHSNYVVPLDKAASCITRPLAEILRDLNKRIPENTLKPNSKVIPWFHANRMLSFYAPGWCGEVRDVIFSDDGSVTVVYRVTIRGSDGEAYREATGTILSNDPDSADPVAAAEEIAFVRACARFGLGLYLYHE